MSDFEKALSNPAEMDAWLEVHSAQEIIDAINGYTGSLRDMFAAKAMASLILARKMADLGNQPKALDVVRESYMFADAMLAERAK